MDFTLGAKEEGEAGALASSSSKLPGSLPPQGLCIPVPPAWDTSPDIPNIPETPQNISTR